MNKSFHSLWRFIQGEEAANRRYLTAPAPGPADQADDCRSGCPGSWPQVDGVRYPKMNPVAPDQHQIFQAVLAGENGLSGEAP